MSIPLTFSFDPFEGVLCGLCGEKFDPEKLQGRNLTKHNSNCHKDDSFDAKEEMKKLRESAMTLKQVLVAADSEDAQKKTLDWFLTTKTMDWCGVCKRGFDKKRKHKWDTAAAHQPQIQKNQILHFSRFAKSPKKFFKATETSYAHYEGKFSNFFKVFFTSEKCPRVSNQAAYNTMGMILKNQLRAYPSHGQSFDAQPSDPERHRKNLENAAPMDMSFMPPSTKALAKIYDSDDGPKESNLETLLGPNHFHCVGVFEREQLAPRSGDHTKLMDFEEKIGL